MSDIHALYHVAEKLMDNDQQNEALIKLQELLKIDESFVLAHLAMARVCTKLGQHELAIEHANRACELEPNEVFNFTALSVTYQRAWAGTNDLKYIQLAEDARDVAHRLKH